MYNIECEICKQSQWLKHKHGTVECFALRLTFWKGLEERELCAFTRAKLLWRNGKCTFFFSTICLALEVFTVYLLSPFEVDQHCFACRRSAFAFGKVYREGLCFRVHTISVVPPVANT